MRRYSGVCPARPARPGSVSLGLIWGIGRPQYLLGSIPSGIARGDCRYWRRCSEDRCGKPSPKGRLSMRPATTSLSIMRHLCAISGPCRCRHDLLELVETAREGLVLRSIGLRRWWLWWHLCWTLQSYT